MPEAYSKEELAYLERAYMEFGFYRCEEVSIEDLIRIGRQLSLGKNVNLPSLGSK